MNNTNNIIIGYKMDFYSNLNSKIMLRNLKIVYSGIKLVKILNKDITDKSHFIKNKDILLNSNNGDIYKYRLFITPIEYKKSIKLLIKLADVINSYGYTLYDSNLKINISSTEHIEAIKVINPLKFILNFDESEVYTKFPNRRNFTSALSINKVFPKVNTFPIDIENINFNNYGLPIGNRYGINFNKLKKGYIQFKYLGGLNYVKKISQIIKCIDYFANFTNMLISEPNFNDTDKKKLKHKLYKFNKIYRNISDYKTFKTNYPNLKLTVDLLENNIADKYVIIKDRLFGFLLNSNIKKGVLNFDLDKNKIQIKDTTIDEQFYFLDIDIINSNISKSTFNNCEIYNTTLKNCYINKTELIENKISYSKIVDSEMYKNNIIKDSFIIGMNTIVQGKITNCIIKDCIIMKINKSSNTLINIENN